MRVLAFCYNQEQSPKLPAKRCNDCNGECKMFFDKRGNTAIGCPKCNVGYSHLNYHLEEQAIIAWNKNSKPQDKGMRK